jgi:hypothetical protein
MQPRRREIIAEEDLAPMPYAEMILESIKNINGAYDINQH